LFPKLKEMGKEILYITLLEAELAFLITAGGLLVFFYFMNPFSGNSFIGLFLPVALLLGSLASPTDPSATLAVKTEFKAKGPVMSTIMGVAVFDDVLGIVNYSLATAVAVALISQEPVVFSTVIQPFLSIAGGVVLGIGFGMLLNFITGLVKREEDGVLLVILAGILFITFGVAGYLNIDELLATMTVGVVVVNFNPRQDAIFRVLEHLSFCRESFGCLRRWVAGPFAQGCQKRCNRWIVTTRGNCCWACPDDEPKSGVFRIFRSNPECCSRSYNYS